MKPTDRLPRIPLAFAVLVGACLVISGCKKKEKTKDKPAPKTGKTDSVAKVDPKPKKTVKTKKTEPRKTKPVKVVKKDPKPKTKTPSNPAKAALKRITELGGEYKLNISKEVSWIKLADTAVKDDDLESLKYFPFLISLDLSRTEITDKGLVHVAKVGRLRELFLRNVKGITDKGLETISDLTLMQKACFDETSITEAGFKHFKNWEEIQLLHVRGRDTTKFTDAGLEQIAKLTTIRDLAIRGDGITKKRVTALKGALRLTKFQWDQPMSKKID